MMPDRSNGGDRTPTGSAIGGIKGTYSDLVSGINQHSHRDIWTHSRVPPASKSVNNEISHTLCLASKDTEGSVARSLGPPPTYLVIPGRRPLVHDAPLFVDVAKPVAQLPPSEIRPTWKVATMVEPFEYV